MAKKSPKNDRTPREKTPLDADSVDAKAHDLADLARKLSEIATKMRTRHVSTIEAMGLTNWQQGYEKLRSSTNSIERALVDELNAPVKRKVVEKRSSAESK